jgi:hypothetical protein
VKVYILPADTHGCGHYRLVWPAHILGRDFGWDVTIVPPGSKDNDFGFRAVTQEHPGGVKELISIGVPDDTDMLIMQRPAHKFQPTLIRTLVGQGITVVVDMDDDMTNIHRGNIAYNTYSPRSDSPFSWKYATESCREATYVTTSTSTLLKVYGRPGRSQAIDNYVPAATLNYQKPETGRFGWTGVTQSHPDDLTVCGSSARRLINEGHEFRVVGSGVMKRKMPQLPLKSTVKEQLRLDTEPEFTGAVTLNVWVKAIAENLDVGMVPLTPNAFNTSKSRLKGIEYMAAGVAWAASPREEYRKLNRQSGCGLLADTPGEWYKALKRLITDEPFRKEQVEAGREYMKSQTYEANAWRWATAWTEAYEIQQRAHKIQKGLT